MKYLFLLVVIFIGYQSFGQSLLKGQLKNEVGKPVSDANLIVYSNRSQDVLSYSISDDNGVFQLQFNSNADSLRLEITCIGYAKLIRVIANQANQYLNLKLGTATTDLPEIVVKQQAIRLKGDTINYDVKSFSDKSDRVIIDVLKKIPGIKVTEGGQILFNNKPINKFYVEGKDLLENRYSIASNNLPSDAVEQIQVLQNHQPITLLNGIENSDRAAINIKLNKNAKIKLLGNGQIGLGLTPLLSDNKLTLLKFSKEIQFISSVKHNNIGINLDQELNEQNFSQSLYESGSIQNDLVNLVKANPPPINESRYWFNNNTLVTNNYLIGLSKLFDLKFNVAYEHDQIQENASSLTTIYLPDETVVINEGISGTNRFSKLLAGAVLEGNSKKLFLKNALKFQKAWSNGQSSISSLSIDQNLRNPFMSMINELNGIINIDSNLIGISSFTSFSDLPQELTVTPGQFPDVLNSGAPFDRMLQKVQLKGFFTDNAASYTKKIGLFSINEKFGVLAQSQRLSNELSIDQSGVSSPLNGNFQNFITRNKFKAYNETTIGFDDSRFRISLKLKTSINKLENNSQELEQNATKVFFNPTVYVLYKFNSFWETNVSTSSDNNFSYESNPSFLLQNYRSLVSNDIPLSEKRNRSISYGLGYKNIINAVYSNFDVRYSRNISNTIISTTFDGILQTRTALVQDNPYTDLNLSWNINKYYLELKTAIDFSITYNRVKMNQLQQDLLTDFSSETYIFGVKVNSRINKDIALEYAASLTRDQNASIISGEKISYTPNTFLKQHLTFKYFLPADFQVYLNLENFYNRQNVSKKLGYSFADVKLQKSIVKRKLDFSVFVSNLFDLKSYNDFSYMNNNFINSQYSLRGRMLMFNVGFQL